MTLKQNEEERRNSRKRIEEAAERVRHASEGNRHTETLKAARLVGGLLQSSGMERGEAERILIQAGVAAGRGMKDVARDVRDGIRHGSAQPIEATPRRTAYRAPVSSLLGPRPEVAAIPQRVTPSSGSMTITRWTSRANPNGEPERATLESLREWFQNPEVNSRPKDELPQWHAAEYERGYRSGAALQRVHALVLDADKWEGLGPVEIANFAGRWSYLAHTTPSHRPGAARWRVVLPLSSSIGAKEWEDNKGNIAEWVSLKAAANRGRLHLWGESRKEQEEASGFDMIPASQAFYVPTASEHYQSSHSIGAECLPLVEVVKAELPRLRWDAKRAKKRTESEVLRAFTSLKGWLRRVPESRTWLLKEGDDGVLPLGKVGMLAAEGGAGKTMALIQLAVAVASGSSDWLGWDVKTHGPVVLLLGEEDQQEAHRRIYNSATAMHLTDEERLRVEDRLTVAPLTGILCAWTQKNFEGKTTPTESAMDTFEHLRLMAEDRGEGWALIIADPLSRFAGSDAETDSAQATRFVQVAEKLTALPGLVESVGPTVLLAHHTNKASRSAGRTDATAARGSSALTDAVRWQAQLENERDETGAPIEGFARLRVSKSNYAKRPDPLSLARGDWGVLRALTSNDRERLRKLRHKETDEEEAKRKRLERRSRQ